MPDVPRITFSGPNAALYLEACRIGLGWGAILDGLDNVLALHGTILSRGAGMSNGDETPCPTRQ
jgi:hypothetical protein